MSVVYDDLQVGVDPGYHTQPLRPNLSQVSGASLSGFAGSGSNAPVFEPQSPYTVASSNGFYDSGTDSSLEPAVSSVCIQVDPSSFPEGQENGYMFPKGTVVTILASKKTTNKFASTLRGNQDNVYYAKLGFAENAFDPLEFGLPRKNIPNYRAYPDKGTIKDETVSTFCEKMRDEYAKEPYKSMGVNKKSPYFLGRSESMYNDFAWKQYIDRFDATKSVEARTNFFNWATERLVPLGVLAEAVCLSRDTPKVVPVAVKGVCEVALAADFKDPRRVLPKPGQTLYMTVDGAIDQGQRAHLHMMLKGHNNLAWLNALRMKVVVAPTATEKTVLALLQ